MNDYLFEKYASSQNYFYTKEINEILQNQCSIKVVRFKEYQVIDDDDTYLKRFYRFSEYNQKIHLLTEYYKFHINIPRIFINKVDQVYIEYYDLFRKNQYQKLQKQYNLEKKSVYRMEKQKVNKNQNNLLAEIYDESKSRTSQSQNKESMTLFEINEKLAGIINQEPSLTQFLELSQSRT